MSRELKSAIADELAELERANNGLLTRRAVVEKAKDKNTALNQYFIWDKNDAAERYWLETAGALIRSYKVHVKISGSEKPADTRAWVSLASDRLKGGGYRTLASVMDNEDMHDELLATALKELDTFKRKYAVLSELEAIIVEIERVFEQQRAPRRTEEVHASA